MTTLPHRASLDDVAILIPAYNGQPNSNARSRRFARTRRCTY